MASRAQAEAVIAAKAASDASFKARLLADPCAALSETLGSALPVGTKVTVLQETSTEFYIVLPADSSSVSEKELASVAGGCWIGTSGSCSFVTG